ncbi:MAG: serine hydrolase domain-containing protein [Thermomicrobiales bacterium]
MSSDGFSTERLGRMRDVLAGHVDRGAVPGLVAAVSRRGAVHVEAIGRQAIAGAPMRRETIFRIFSLTKPIVAAATMTLVEECRLRLDDPVDAMLPELADRRVLQRLDGPLDETVPAQRPITPRDLLTFRMGFGLLLPPEDAYPIMRAAHELELGQGPPGMSTPPEPDEWMRRLGTLPLMAQPGERWIYNTGSDVLGVLIARVTGQPLETVLRERIFDPLGMKDTAFSVPAEKLDRFTTDYWEDIATGELTVFDAAEASQWGRPPAFPSGAAGLVSTIDDYLSFGQMLLSQGQHGNARILSRPVVELMTMDHLTAEQRATAGPILSEGHGWGFGMGVVTRRDDIAANPGQVGWAGGLELTWFSDPREEVVAILMTQCTRFSTLSASGPAIWRDFRTTAYAAIDD